MPACPRTLPWVDNGSDGNEEPGDDVNDDGEPAVLEVKAWSIKDGVREIDARATNGNGLHEVEAWSIEGGMQEADARPIKDGRRKVDARSTKVVPNERVVISDDLPCNIASAAGSGTSTLLEAIGKPVSELGDRDPEVIASGAGAAVAERGAVHVDLPPSPRPRSGKGHGPSYAEGSKSIMLAWRSRTLASSALTASSSSYGS